MSERLPDEVTALLAERALAREARDWDAADALRDRIRELGWDPIDGPAGSTARPSLVAVTAAEVGYARREDLASRLDEPAAIGASIVVVMADHPSDLDRCLRSLALHLLPRDWELVLVSNAAGGNADDALAAAWPAEADRPPVELLRLGERLGWAEAVNIGLRRARGEVVVLLDTSLESDGDWLTPLLSAFGDPAVGLAGGWGVASGDGRQFEDADPGEVDAIEGYCLAVRREALRAVGGFDHRFRFYRNADLDLSFAIRAAGWRALRTEPLPLIRHDHRGWSSIPEEERDRLSRRNFYRFLKHWGDRRDLLLHPAPPHDHHHDHE